MAGFRAGAAEVLEAAGVILLVSFTFTALGFVIAWQMDSTQGFHAVINLLLLPLWLVSGAVFPIANAHGWVRWLMRLNPVTYSVAALRQSFERHAADAPPFAASLLVTACCAAALFAASAASARRKSARSFG
jgi:ABC-2 type transport system permease protein